MTNTAAVTKSRATRQALKRITPLQARAMTLNSRHKRRVGPHQYVIQAEGHDASGAPQYWHVDLDPNSHAPCTCPAFYAAPTPQICKHIVYFQWYESMLAAVDGVVG